MTKIGRNDICPCGSGKKYKHCCLNNKSNEPDKAIIDIGTMLHIKALATGLLNDNNTKISYFDLLTDFTKSKKANSDSIIEFDIEFFEDLKKYIEEKIIDLCSQQPSYELFFWYRRIKPISRYAVKTDYSYHELMKIAMFSYGTKKNTFVTSNTNGVKASVPLSISCITIEKLISIDVPDCVVDIISVVYQLESLCFYYIYICNCVRIMIKGGLVLRNDEYGLKVVPKDNDIRFLIEYYDRRLNKQTLLAKVGTTSADSSSTDNNYIIFVMQYNFEEHKNDLMKTIKFTDKEDCFNFELEKISIEDYFKVLQKINPIISQKFGFIIEDLLSFIIYFSRTIVASIGASIENENDIKNTLFALNLFQRGYYVLDDTKEVKERLFYSVEAVYKEVFVGSMKPTVKRFLSVFNYLTYFDNGTTTFEEKILHGFILSKVINNMYIVDCTGFVGFLKCFADEFRSIDGEMGNVISKDLEEKVNQEIVKIFNHKSIFCRGEIKSKTGGKKEIDASFIINDCLVIFECKSLSVSEGSIFGSYSALEFRKKKLLEYLAESEDKAKFIVKNLGQLNINLPGNIKYIAPLVITSFPEYIWERSNSLFISNDISRIMLIDEIALLNKHEVYKNMITKPFIIKI